MFPSDRSADLRITLDSIPRLAVGDTFQLSIRAVNPNATGPIAHSDVVYQADNATPPGVLPGPPVATVTADGRLIALSLGATNVTARVRQADTPPALVRVAVGNAFAITRVSPDTVRFGDPLEIEGAGLNPARTLVTVGGVRTTALTFVPVIAASPNGNATLTVIVPVGAQATSRVIVHAGGLEAASPGNVVVLPRDRLEPNDSIPLHLGTLQDSIVFYQAALEVDPTRPGLPRDWYTFTLAAQQDVSIILRSATTFTPDQLYLALSDALSASGAPLPLGWLIAPGANVCKGTVIPGYRLPADSMIIAYRLLPAGTYHVQIATRVAPVAPWPYDLRIVTGYAAQLIADPSEPDDGCGVAPSVGTLCVRTGVPAGCAPALGNHLMENVAAIDWLRFSTVDSTGDWTFRAIGNVNGRALIILTAAGQFVAGGLDARLDWRSLTVCLPPGQYLLGVFDMAGETINYSPSYSWLGARVCP